MKANLFEEMALAVADAAPTSLPGEVTQEQLIVVSLPLRPSPPSGGRRATNSSFLPRRVAGFCCRPLPLRLGSVGVLEAYRYSTT